MNREEVLSLLDGVLARMKDMNVSSLEISFDDVSISAQRGHVMSATHTVPMAAAAAVPAVEAPPASNANAVVVKSPIVGTFYAASAPDAPNFVSVGAKVSKGNTLCIVEAMKMMNEIEAEHNGVITRIFVKNGDMVEFGQPLFEMEAV